MKVSKSSRGLMCSKGYRLYTEIWNDQPPVSTMILKTAFHWFGTSILTARLVAAGFGLLLMGAFHELVRLRSGKWAALLATFFLLASPGVLLLSVSVMLEVPAFATALLSALLLLLWLKRQHPLWLFASGAVMAIALQIKLTSALVAPAILIELWLSCSPRLYPTKRTLIKVLP
jgi:4-amino-4-deoxy-L-arabinose transferase-like glycosyltransferase